METILGNTVRHRHTKDIGLCVSDSYMGYDDEGSYLRMAHVWFFGSDEPTEVTAGDLDIVELFTGCGHDYNCDSKEVIKLRVKTQMRVGTAWKYCD